MSKFSVIKFCRHIVSSCERLSNRVSLHAIFGSHRSTSNGLLQLSRYCIIFLSFLFCTIPTFATTSVTGNIQDLSGTAVGNGAFVRFYLRGCSGNQPRINGTALIGPTQGATYYKDFVASSSGAISGILYSTRDVTGLLGGDITCGTSTTGVWYGMTVIIGGKSGPEIPVHALNTATLNISSVTPITTTPVVTAPTGDSTYFRKDAGNSPITGPTALNSSLTVSGAATLTNVNNTFYISQFAGADLGAKMNAAVTNCTVTLGLTSCKYIIDVGGTISTPPNFPMGSIVDCQATTAIQLQTQWTLQHRGVIYRMNGCQFYYSQDTGNAAFYIGKNLSGTVTCNGTVNVAWVSGSQFTQFDTGDKAIINGASYNVGSGSTATNLVLLQTCPIAAGVSYAGWMNSSAGLGPFQNSITLKDVTVQYTGAGTNANNAGIRVVAASNLVIENPYLTAFTTGYGFFSQGMLASEIRSMKLISNKNALLLDATNIGGGGAGVIGSNQNKFWPLVIIGSPAGGNPVLIQGGSSGNTIGPADFEGNAATVTGTITGSAFGNIVIGGDHERNGDGTVNSADWSCLSGPGNTWISNNFTSGLANTPATGIILGTGCSNPLLMNNHWNNGTLYTAPWTVANSTVTPVLINNYVAGFASGTMWNFGASLINGVTDTTSTIVQEWYPGASGRSGCFHISDSATYNSELCADGATGDWVFYTGRFPGSVGTERFRIKMATGTIQLGAAASGDIGTTLLPFGNLWLGTAATNNTKIIGSATTAARNLTLPDADSLTPSFLSCGTTSTCAKTNQTRLIVLNGGPIALSGGTLTITSLPFTSSTSYVCQPDDSTGINGIDVVYVSASSVTFNGTGTDSIRYTCIGN